ncbi:DUF433 domain-containing protein [candidate division KSB1 bacterium]|nr:DUF433 domain-containing protein [candidate division KSB1 bacterium]
MMTTFDRITYNPQVLGGKACIRGLRITVSLVLNLLANGMTSKEIIDDYPDLENKDIQQCLQYAAYLASDEVYADTGVSLL